MNFSFVTARSESTRQSMSEGIPAWIATAFGLAMTGVHTFRGRGVVIARSAATRQSMTSSYMDCRASLAVTKWMAWIATVPRIRGKSTES